MKRASILEKEYNEFLKQLSSAKREKRCLDPLLDKDRFADEISARDIKHTAFASIVEQRYQASEMYLITSGPEEWTGLFAIDRDTHACLQFVVKDI